MTQLTTPPAPLTGLELMHALKAGDLPAPGFAVTLGIEPVAFSEGRAAFALDPGPEHLSPLGTVHGGILSTLLDSAVGCAIHTTLGARDLYTTVDLDVKFVRPVRPGQGRVTAEARTVHVGGRIADRRGPDRGRGRHALRARDHDLPDHARLESRGCAPPRSRPTTSRR